MIKNIEFPKNTQIPNDVIDNITSTYIAPSFIHGLGLFADLDIDAGVVLGTLDGQQISWDLYTKQELAFEWNAIQPEVLLVRPYRTKYSYINHSRDPNLLLDTNPLRVISKRFIRKGEEVTLDYRCEPLPKEYILKKGKSYL